MTPDPRNGQASGCDHADCTACIVQRPLGVETERNEQRPTESNLTALGDSGVDTSPQGPGSRRPPASACPVPGPCYGW